MKSPDTVFLISLGCSKNLVDSEHILGLLRYKGFKIAPCIEETDTVVINTCAFIQSAVEESIEVILEMADRKKRGMFQRLFVVGCFVQRYGYKLKREIPEVDGWVGTGEFIRIPDLMASDTNHYPEFFINRPTALVDHTTPRLRTTPFYTAFLKIAEGCSHRCSFCTIPSLRGPFRSRNLDSLIIEVKALIDNGVKEINLIAQDSTMYGKDLDGDTDLIKLLEELLRLHGIQWIRVLYCHPSGISDRLLNLMETEGAICPYIDIPLQHINKKVLKAMGRDVRKKDPLQLMESIRSMKRSISLRTTFMLGFPGETDEIFEELYDFVSTIKFDHMGAFIFSPEKGTVAARLEDIPDAKVAKERLNAIMSLQRGISEKKNQALVGQTRAVLIEGESDETDLLLSGRTATMAPDVDGHVLINKGQGNIGEITTVRFTEAYPYDLIGEIVS